MKYSYYLALPLVCCALSACSSSKEVLPPCPQVAIVRALETFNDYGSDLPVPQNLVAVAKMDDVIGSCSYTDEGVEVDYELSMRALKGKRLGGDQVSIPFFVSIVDDHNKVVSKELMTANFKFKKDPVAAYKEPIHIVLPYLGESKLTGQRVLMGFQLTQEQRLKQIREERKRLKKKVR